MLDEEVCVLRVDVARQFDVSRISTAPTSFVQNEYTLSERSYQGPQALAREHVQVDVEELRHLVARFRVHRPRYRPPNTADQLRGPRRPLANADLVSCIR